MKSRNSIFAAILSALVCFALLPNAQAAPAPETPDPGSVGGTLNTADGQSALAFVTSGVANSAFGAFAQFSITTGNFNTAVGAGALDLNNGDSNTAVGTAALLLNTGSANTAVGVSAGINNATGSNNIYVGDSGVDGESNVIAIGAITATGTAYDSFFVGGVFGADVDVGTAVPVLIDAGGRLGTNPVAANGKARVRNPQGAQPQAMLNELQKEQKRIAELEATVKRLAATVKEQAAQIQKVSAQLEMSKPAPHVVANKE